MKTGGSSVPPNRQCYATGKSQPRSAASKQPANRSTEASPCVKGRNGDVTPSPQWTSSPRGYGPRGQPPGIQHAYEFRLFDRAILITIDAPSYSDSFRDPRGI